MHCPEGVLPVKPPTKEKAKAKAKRMSSAQGSPQPFLFVREPRMHLHVIRSPGGLGGSGSSSGQEESRQLQGLFDSAAADTRHAFVLVLHKYVALNSSRGVP